MVDLIKIFEVKNESLRENFDNVCLALVYDQVFCFMSVFRKVMVKVKYKYIHYDTSTWFYSVSLFPLLTL